MLKAQTKKAEEWVSILQLPINVLWAKRQQKPIMCAAAASGPHDSAVN